MTMIATAGVRSKQDYGGNIRNLAYICVSVWQAQRRVIYTFMTFLH